LAGMVSTFAAVHQKEDHPLLPGPLASELPPGEFPFAWIVGPYGLQHVVGLTREQLSHHIFISGLTGTGKTTLIKLLITLAQVRTWIISFEHGEFLDLLPQFPDLLLVTPREFKRNPLQPLPGELPVATSARVKNALRGTFLRDGACNMAGDFIMSLYKAKGVLDGGMDYPTIGDLYAAVKATGFRPLSRHFQYAEGLTNRLQNLQTYLGESYDCTEGYDLGELLHRSVLFDLSGLPFDVAFFCVNELLAAVADYRTLYPQQAVLSNLIVLDEVHQLLAESPDRNDLAEPQLCQVMRKFRRRGIGMVLATQTVEGVPSAVIGNAGTRVAFRLVSGGCVSAVARSMSLDREARTLLTELPARRAVMHYAGFPRPFVIEVPHVAMG